MRARRAAYLLGPATIVGTAVLLGVRRGLLLVTVMERSMEPTLRSGDRVLVRRVAGRRVRPGQLVVVRRNFGTGSLIIKRVAAVPGDAVPPQVAAAIGQQRPVPAGSLVLLGDNPAESSDSRLVGFYRLADVVGVVTRMPAR